MSTFIIGRTLDAAGKPIHGTGVEVSLSSPTLKLLKTQTKPVLFSNPITKEIGAVITIEREGGNKVSKGLCLLPPGGSGPPMHIHPSYDEVFEVVEGEFVFFFKKERRRLAVGEKITVPRGVSHTFRPAGSKPAAFTVEAKPPGNLNEVIHTIFGLAHENKLNAKGRPGFWQGIAIGHELSNDTLFSTPPPSVQKLMFKLFGKGAQKRGYKAIYPEYMEDEYWKSKVEQLAW